MLTITSTDHSESTTFLLDRSKGRSRYFSKLQPELVTSIATLRRSLPHGNRNSLWISYDPDLTDSLLRTLTWPSKILGRALFLHAISLQSLPSLTSCFKRIAFSTSNGFLPPEELADVLESEHKSDLLLGGSVDHVNRTITLWRGDLEPLTVPFSAFEKSGDGIEPDFQQFSVTDFGQTVRLGSYEAATEALLYEFDPRYRSQINKSRQASEQSFGASLRRLRLQRGLKREDFAPDVAAKTIARIEQGGIRRIQARTLGAIARRLSVKPGEIESY